MASTNKTTVAAQVLTGLAVLGVCVAALMAFTGDGYVALMGIVVFYASLIVAAVALPFWAWGRSGSQAGVIVVLGALGVGAVYFAGLYGIGGLHSAGRARNQMQRNAFAEKEYLAGKAFNFINVRYDIDKNQLVRTGPSSGEILNSAVAIPFGEAYLLVLIDSSAYVFDGTSSTRVDFTGEIIKNGTAVTAGTLSFRQEIYTIDAIGLDWAMVKPGRDKGGDEYGRNHPLVDAIAPMK
jgi:hypothetical protein